MQSLKWVLALLMTLGHISAVEVLSEARYSGGESKVVLQVQRDESGTLRLVGQFSPDTLEPGDWHFYDKDMTGSLGVATEMALQPGGWLQANGPLEAHQPVKNIDFFGDIIKVYPDGPAVFSQVVALAEGLPDASTPAQVKISYMLCSDEICQMPQQDVPLNLAKSLTALALKPISLTNEQPAVSGGSFSPQFTPGNFGAVNFEVTPAPTTEDPVSQPSASAEVLQTRRLQFDLEPSATLPPLKVAAAELEWYNPANVADIAAVIEYARSQGKAAMLDFTGPSCIVCQQYKKTVMPQQPVKEALAQLIRIRLDTDTHGALAVWQQEQFLTQSRPYYVVVQPDGSLETWSGPIKASDPESIAEYAAFLGGDSGVDEELPTDWLGFILLAIGGGLFTLLMPCTYPMIPLTVNFFTKQREAGQALVPLAAAYALGIMFFFVAIGVVVVMVLGGAVSSFAGDPVTNLLIALLFLILGLSLLDVFFLRLPASWGSALGGGRGGIAGALIMGATFAITAFTCTAPFAGAVLAAGATGGDWLRPIVGMTIYSSVIAVPFFVLSLSPALLAKLPRAGAWMSEFKHAGGIIEIAAALKFFVIADVHWDWGLFNRGTVLGMWLVAAVLLALYCWGPLRLQGDSPVQQRSPARWISGGVFLLLALVLLYGLGGGSLGGVVEGFFPVPAE